MDEIYRSMDFLYTNQRIVTQTVGEAVAIGLKVIAHDGNKVAAQTINTENPIELISAIKDLYNRENGHIWKLKYFGEKMNEIYQKILN